MEAEAGTGNGVQLPPQALVLLSACAFIIFFLYLFPSFISFLFVVDIVLVWVSGNDWIKWETFESHRRFQVFSQLNQIRLKQKWN